jgi:transposase InsO family protein
LGPISSPGGPAISATLGRCGGSVRVIACIEDQEIIDRILAHLHKTEQAKPALPLLTGANLRVLDIEGIKSLPNVPMSHPFVERLIGSIRRELLDQTLFWTATDLENELREYQYYYNEHRCHAGWDGATPVDSGSENIATLNDYRWKKHCRGLFQLPVAA